MYRRLWQLHSWLGLLAGLGLILIGLSGSLLVFHEEIEAAFNPGVVTVSPKDGGRLSLDTLLRSLEEQLPDYEVTGWLLQNEKPHLADIVYMIKHGTTEWKLATLDPYTGKLLASPRHPHDTFTGWMLDFHYTFFADHFGVGLAGVFALMLCLLGVSGFWLYRKFWRNLLMLRWGRGLRILFSDTHKFVGITSVVFNLLLGFTGAYWNIAHVIGEWGHAHDEKPVRARMYAEDLSLTSMVRDAAGRLIGFHTHFISLPFEPGAPVTLWGAVEPRAFLQGEFGSTVVYDAKTSEHKSTTDARDLGWWARVVDTFTALHFGTFGGVTVKILWTLGGLAPGVLAITGFGIWWSRKRRRQPVNAAA